MTPKRSAREPRISRKRQRVADRRGQAAVIEADQEARAQQVKPKRQVKPFVPATDRQADYVEAVTYATFTFSTGPAGCGKTYVAACLAAEHLRAAPDTKVILTRPAVEAAGERLGFMPGGLDEKFGPYMRPLMRTLIERLGEGFVACAVKNERIVCLPMAFMRGETFTDALIIADEMQNATREQLKMLLTRIGEGSRMVIDGDPQQTDLGEESGLEDAIRRLSNVKGVSVVRFTRSDIVRHSIIQDVLEAYEGR